MPPRLIGLYALATMEREGQIHGYRLSTTIAERTGGTWRPGAGAVYPSLRALVERGLARRSGQGRRREYRITPRGRALLRTVRRRVSAGRASRADPAPLWAEIVGEANLGKFLVRRLERSLASVDGYLASHADSDEATDVRREVRRLLVARRELGKPPRARQRTRDPRP